MKPMMRLYLTCKFALISCLCLSCFAQMAQAQISLTENQALYFGEFAFASINDPIEISVDTGGNVTSNSNTTIINGPTRGEYTITGGTPNAAYTITTDTSGTLENGATGTFTVDNIVVSPAASNFDAFGDTNIVIGARLSAPGDGTQFTNGSYTETLNLTISY